jgi:hypothetical protein
MVHGGPTSEKSSPEITPDGISGRQTLPQEDQKEEGCSRNLTTRSDGSGAVATWPAAKQYSGGGMSFGNKVTGAQRSGTGGGMSSGG